MRPMKKVDQEKYKKTLLALKGRLAGTVSGMRREALEKEGAPSLDALADHGTDLFDQDLTLSLLENEQETIQAIDEALQRLALGSYGACEHCSKPISKARLDALPHAKLCLACKEAEENGAA